MENVQDFALSQARGSFEQSYHTLLNCFCFCGVLFLFFLSQKVAGGLCLSSTGWLPSRSSLPATPSLLWIVFLVHSHQGSQPFNASVLAEEGR